MTGALEILTALFAGILAGWFLRGALTQPKETR